MKRRDFLGQTALLSGIAGSFLAGNNVFAEETTKETQDKEIPLPAETGRFNREKIAFNTSCILQKELTIEEELAVAAEAGFRAVEIWTVRIGNYLERGGTLRDLKKRADDLGLQIINGIGFATWIMNEEDQRAEGLATMRREMEWLAELGAPYVAAPAAGPWQDRIEGIQTIADRFRAVMELGDETGVRPMLELWGTSPTFSQLSEVAAVGLATGRSDAYFLLDAYHLYRGGNSYDSLALLSGTALPVFHLNDYPDAPIETLTDKDRVFPGDGICPMTSLLRRLRSIRFDGYLSLELFNPVYQESMTPLELALKGFEKMNQVLDAAEI